MPPTLQISIPTTSLSTTSKPYTIYHVHLTLPLRTHTLQKRYSDFVALNTLLTSQTGSAPPVPLPPKSWLRSTVSSAELTSQRRAGLESYLRSILDTDDGRWRQSPAWRSFLDLPKGLTASASTTNSTAGSDWDSQSKTNGTDDGDAAGLDANAWLQAHRDVKSCIHNARLAVRRREAAGTAQEQHGAAAEAKAALVRAATGIAACETGLRKLAGASGDGAGWGGGGRLGEGEVRRRRDLLASARKEVEGLETQLRSLALSRSGGGAGGGGVGAGAMASAGDKAGLWEGTAVAAGSGGGKVKSGRVLGGGGAAKETERTRELDNKGVLQLQKQVMEEQEQDVLEIGKAVSRMKEMGIMINEELVVQNQMLGLVESDVDRLQGKLDVGKKRMAKIR